MLFNSFEFLLFFPLVFAVYWALQIKGYRLQNLFILVASLFFYGWWDWRFLGLLSLSAAIDYFVAILIAQTKANNWRKFFLTLSLVSNLGLLVTFKYFDFFIESFNHINAFLPGGGFSLPTLQLILPVGISFYTFQTMSYTIDVYRKQLVATKDFIAFMGFISFFPQLVAGPIERASNLLPQFLTKRSFSYEKAVDGMRQILWGLVKKVVIADNCAEYVNLIFNGYNDFNGATLALGGVFFAFQIYGDFSGYSDMAIGFSRLLGFELMQNFRFPYFANGIPDFWRRWHISLSTWFRDYVYVPLGGSRGTVGKTVCNTVLVFLVSGLWHGANWTFIAWGGLNAIYFIPTLVAPRAIDQVLKIGSRIPGFGFLRIGATFGLICFAWIFFRAESLDQALGYAWKILSSEFWHLPEQRPSYLIGLIFAFILVEWFGRHDQFALQTVFSGFKKGIRRSIYVVLAVLVYVHSGSEQPFIYFQF